MTSDPSKYMHLAIVSAREGIQRNDGGPFGACVVCGGDVLAVAHNTVLRDQDPTAHAEINAIREACRKLGNHDLSRCEMYSTAEPCPMCLGAIYWARIGRMYVGVDRQVVADYGFDDARFYAELDRPARQRKLVSEAGLLATECEALFAEWKRLGRPLY